MKDDPNIVTDEIPEKVHKSLHLAYFITKMLVIGVIFFVAAQIAFLALVVEEDKEQDDYGAEFGGHNYCGTFFIEQTAENTYGSAEAAKQANAQAKESSKAPVVVDVLFNAMSIAMALCLFLALRCGDKKVIFAKKSSKYFLIAGTLWAVVNIWTEYLSYSLERSLHEHYVGIFANGRYYCQLYNILAIPFIIFCCGLVLRQHEHGLNGRSVKGNSTALKTAAIAVLIVGGGFILYRFGVRAYELTAILSGKELSVKLPFYSTLLELPYELARTPGDYTKLIVFRFVKDLPVFAASAITVIMLAKLLFCAAKSDINTDVNKKRLSISIIALIISSVLFNVLGIFEINMLNSGFTGIYGEVVYTIGIRALCEPMLYAFVIWFFSIYIRCVPKKQEIPQ